MAKFAHEDYSRAHAGRRSSNREFGLVIGAFLCLIGLAPLLRGGAIRPLPLGVAAVFAACALAVPSLLAPLNRAWTAFGLLLGRVMAPVFTGVLFFLVFTPVATLFRLTGRDALRLKWSKAQSSYWIVRTPPGPKPDTMIRQF